MFSEKINKMNKLLARLTDIKREKTQMTNIINESGDITTYPKPTLKKLKGNTTKILTSINFIDKWINSLKNYKLLKLIQDEIDTLNSPIAIKDIEFVV